MTELIDTADKYAAYVERECKRAVEICVRILPPGSSIESDEFIWLVANIAPKMVLPAHTLLINLRGNLDLIAERALKVGHGQPGDKVRETLERRGRRGRRRKSISEGAVTNPVRNEPHVNGELSSVTTTAVPSEATVSNSATTVTKSETRPLLAKDAGEKTNLQIPHNGTTNDARGDERGLKRPAGEGRGDNEDKDGDAGGPGRPRPAPAPPGQP